MSKEVIIVDGEEKVVREDTAKAFRGVYWAILSLAAILLIMVILMFTGVIKLASDGQLNKTPADVEANRLP